jgi:hypothetical protein
VSGVGRNALTPNAFVYEERLPFHNGLEQGALNDQEKAMRFLK